VPGAVGLLAAPLCLWLPVVATSPWLPSSACVACIKGGWRVRRACLIMAPCETVAAPFFALPPLPSTDPLHRSPRTAGRRSPRPTSRGVARSPPPALITASLPCAAVVTVPKTRTGGGEGRPAPFGIRQAHERGDSASSESQTPPPPRPTGGRAAPTRTVARNGCCRGRQRAAYGGGGASGCVLSQTRAKVTLFAAVFLSGRWRRFRPAPRARPGSRATDHGLAVPQTPAVPKPFRC